MRLLILAATAALTLCGCGKNDQTENAQDVNESLTAESIVANDVTAIDAVTADAANMAADVDINFTNDMALASDDPATVGTRLKTDPEPRRRTPAPRAPVSRPPVDERAAASDGNSTSQEP